MNMKEEFNEKEIQLFLKNGKYLFGTIIKESDKFLFLKNPERKNITVVAFADINQIKFAESRAERAEKTE